MNHNAALGRTDFIQINNARMILIVAKNYVTRSTSAITTSALLFRAFVSSMVGPWRTVVLGHVHVLCLEPCDGPIYVLQSQNRQQEDTIAMN